MPTPDLAQTVPEAFHLGWTMASLYTVKTGAGGGDRRDHLASEHELDTRDRINLEMIRLKSLLGRLSDTTAYGTIFVPETDEVFQAWWQDASGTRTTTPSEQDSVSRAQALNQKLPNLNFSILTNLVKCGLSVELAYQTGRSLRDSVNPPPHPDPAPDSDQPVRSQVDPAVRGVTWSLGRERITTIQEWLTTLAPQFPSKAAKVVSTSVGRWADFCAVTLVDDGPGRLRYSGVPGGQTRENLAKTMADLLLRQGDTWLSLLIGEKTTDALLSPEGLVAAGDAALRRTARIIGKVLWRYRAALVVILIALAAVLTLAALYLGGASKVWTSIAGITGAFGVTWKGVGGAIPKLAKNAETPIFGLEEIEAMAWTVTDLPSATVTRGGVTYLRQAGAAPPGPLGLS